MGFLSKKKKEEQDKGLPEEETDESGLSPEQLEMYNDIAKAAPPGLEDENGQQPFFSRGVESEIDLRTQKLLTPEYQATKVKKVIDGKVEEVDLDLPEPFTADWLGAYMDSEFTRELVKDHMFLLNLLYRSKVHDKINMDSAIWFITNQMFVQINLSRADGRNVDRAMTARSYAVQKQTRKDIPLKEKKFGLF